MALDSQNLSGNSSTMDSAKQAIDDLFEGQQETYEELMGKLGLVAHANGNATSSAVEENGNNIRNSLILICFQLHFPIYLNMIRPSFRENVYARQMLIHQFGDAPTKNNNN